MPIYYHITSIPNARKILREGLKPGVGQGFLASEGIIPKDESQFIYLIAEPPGIAEILSSWKRKRADRPVLLEITTNQEAEVDLEFGPQWWEDSFVRVRNPIPARNIRAVPAHFWREE